MSDPETLIRAQALALAYDGRPVLEDATFAVRAGEFWCVLGPNGSGKSTLLRAMLGLERPASGTLWLHPERARRDHIGFVPQRCDLKPTLPTTVREFVLLGSVGLSLPRAEAESRLAWALERVGLPGGARRDYWTLSGGERQRVLLARALVRRPALLLLDEPTTYLDRDGERRMLEVLAELEREDGVTLVLVTHDERIAVRHATHVAVLADRTLVTGERATMLARREAGAC